MKFTKTLATIALSAVAVAASAQDFKFAHIDSQKLISELPERMAANETLQAEATKLEEQLRVMQADLETKYNEYLNDRETMPELIRATKEKEIQDANQRMQSYQQLAQQQLSQKEQQLIMPIIEKYQKAVEEVGAENGYIYIFDVSSQVILYHSDQSTDVSELVKAKMNAATN